MRDAAVLGTLVILVSALAAASSPDPAVAAEGWRAEPALVERMSSKRPEIIYNEAEVPKYELPDPLKARDGRVVTSPQEWKARRQELLLKHVLSGNEAG